MKSKTKIWLGVGAFVVAGVNGATARRRANAGPVCLRYRADARAAPTDISAQKKSGGEHGEHGERGGKKAKKQGGEKAARAVRKAAQRAEPSFRRISISRFASRRCADISWSAMSW